MSKGEQTRLDILDHAVLRASTMGLEGISVGALASALGMSKSGLYAHFGSKGALQAAIVDRAAEQFTDAVIRPALRAPRGESRVRALYELWMAWFEEIRHETGCLFVSAAAELDDRPCPARDRLVAQIQDLMEFSASVVRAAVREGHFRADLDAEQFAFESYGILLAYHQYARLMGDERASASVWRGLDRLFADARVGNTPD